MHDVQRAIARWRQVGHCLPREVRERVFEPAFDDVVRVWLLRRKDAGGLPLGAYTLWTVLRCAPIALPRIFIDHGRLTKLGRIAIAVAAIGTSLFLAVLIVLRPYLRYDP